MMFDFWLGCSIIDIGFVYVQANSEENIICVKSTLFPRRLIVWNEANAVAISEGRSPLMKWYVEGYNNA
jgi:hypothetical protein